MSLMRQSIHLSKTATNCIGNSERANRQEPIRSGPPNRMNDLAYRDWMKFQKSFFWFTSSQALIEECIRFFTKSIWPDGTPSRSLIIGFDDFDKKRIPEPRIIVSSRYLLSLKDVISDLTQRVRNGEEYDFIVVNLQKIMDSEERLLQFLHAESEDFFESIRKLLRSQRYCGILTNPLKSSGDFPIPWSIGSSGRSQLKLRDEKVGLVADLKQIYYLIFFQAEPDRRLPMVLSPPALSRTKEKLPELPLWIIPKPPARRKQELVHPGKFPEILVSTFIKIFSKAGDTIFDPMVGTGSTLIAALRSGRNGVGVELNPQFIKIARERLFKESPTPLIEDPKRPKFRLIQGDASHLNDISELATAQFAYCVTSPPYWSVLKNRGSEYQRSRRVKGLPLFYSDDKRDLGNIENYEDFLIALSNIYRQVAEKLSSKGYLTIVVKNVKRHHVLYTLAWDLLQELSSSTHAFDYVGTTLWCQDDISLKPFALGTHWVSNTLHQYCLHFRKKS